MNQNKRQAEAEGAEMKVTGRVLWRRGRVPRSQTIANLLLLVLVGISWTNIIVYVFTELPRITRATTVTGDQFTGCDGRGGGGDG